jgi:hypothetical protein
VILHFGDWHGEPPLVSQVYSERVLAYRVPLLLRGKLGRTAGIELYIFGISAGGLKAPMAEGPVLAQSGRWAKQRRQLSSNNRNLLVLPDLLERWAASSAFPPVTTFAFNARDADRARSF